MWIFENLENLQAKMRNPWNVKKSPWKNPNFINIILGVGTSDSKVKVYDVRSLKLQQQYSAHEGPVNQVSFHPSGSYLVSASQDKTVRLFDLLTVKPICTLYGHEKVWTNVINMLKGTKATLHR